MNSVPSIKQENETVCSLSVQATDHDLQCVGRSTSYGRASTQGTISSCLLLIDDPTAYVVIEDHEEVSLDVKIPVNKTEGHSSVMSSMNVLESVLNVTNDNSDSEESANSASSLWVSCGKHKLNIADKMIVESGGELTDKHVQMSQYLIKC